MSSHLSVSVAPAPTAPAPGLSSGPASKQGGPLGAFAGLLDAIAGFSRQDATAAKPRDRREPADTAITVPLAATASSTETGAPDTAAPPDGTPPQLLGELVTALAAIETAEQAGEPVDPHVLKRAKAAIDAIAAFVTASPPPANATDDATAATLTPGGGDTKIDEAAAHQLAAARTTLGEFADKLTKLANTLSAAQPDLAARLETLAKQLDPKAISPATLAQFGLDPQATADDASLAAALNGFINGKPTPRADPQPSLGTANLKLPADGALAAGTDNGKPPAPPTTLHTDKPNPPAPAAATASAPSAKADDARSRPDAAKAETVAASVQSATDKPAAPAPQPGASVPITVGPPAATAPLLQAQSAYLATAVPINLPQMAFEIVRHTQLGANHFQIRLDPADLGRVDVRLAIDGTGTINAHLTVDRPETLDLLKRDAATLSQALAQAGLDAGKTNLQFSLNQNPFARDDNGADTASTGNADADAAGADTASIASISRYRGTASPGGLNLFV